MRLSNFARRLLVVAALSILTSAAFAGGPLIVDPQTRKAFTYGHGTTVPVYYDLGNLGTVIDYSVYPPVTVTFDNAVGKQLVETGFQSWSSIPTSSFRARVIGDFSLIGLPNIDSTNVTDIIGGPERYGVYVIFDEDGSIMQNFFGAPPNVLGISSPQYAKPNTTTITMSWTVLNGSSIDPHDTNAAQYQGVGTHEFGHSLGMAHTQTNGAAYFFQDNVGPGSCSNLPYNTNLTSADIETMYPYINNSASGGTGIAQANIHTLDTTGSFSDLYPGPGWPNSYGTITGKVLDLNQTGQLTGVNVIARNINDPFVDATSAVSGQMTQGRLGPDGTFTLHGLKPGAQYVLYVDAIVAGGFPTPPLWFLPGPERFWVGASAPIYDSCLYTTVTAAGHQRTVANIPFMHKPGTPMLYILGYGTGVSSLTSAGDVAVGNYGRGGPIFKWSVGTGVQLMPNVSSEGNKTTISPNGQYIADDLLDNNGNPIGAYRWDMKNGWMQLSQIGHCDGDSSSSFTAANDGSVLGFAYTDNTCLNYHAFRWHPSSGITILPSATTKQDGSPSNSRVDQVSADGKTAVGWEEAWWGGWNAALWTGISAGGATPNTVLDKDGNPVSEAFTISGDGSVMAGQVYTGQYPYDGSGWRRTSGATLDYFPGFSGVSNTNPYALSSDGSVMVGFSGDPWFDFTYGPFLWTTQLGTVNLDDFVKLMGGDLLGLYSLNVPNAMSADGSTIGGWSGGNLGYTGWVLQIKSAYVCHGTIGGSGGFRTLSVSFPVDFDKHLADGDTAGPCQTTK